MIVEKVLEKINIRPHLAKLMIGSVLTALIISLGMMGILRLVGFQMNPGIPVVMGVIGSVAYAARA